MTRPWYCTREDVKSALDVKQTARNNKQIDRAIESSASTVEATLRRRFYPELTTRYFDFPDWHVGGGSLRLWLENNELISITSLVSGGTALVQNTNYFLRRPDGLEEPPYTYIEINRSVASAFNVGNTTQRNVAINGVYGFSATDDVAGAMSASGINASVTSINVLNSSIIGVGDLIHIEDERLYVTEKSLVTSGQTLQTDLTAQKNNETVVVSDGTTFYAGEVITLDAERMLIVSISGNNLTVERAWDGSTLAAHSGSTIYAPRTLTVVRGVLGTTAATHSASTAITKQVYPGLVRDLNIAYALNQVLQENSGYARVSGGGDNQREFTGRSIQSIEQDAIKAYGRNLMMAAV